jgi:hypothetical protein
MHTAQYCNEKKWHNILDFSQYMPMEWGEAGSRTEATLCLCGSGIKSFVFPFLDPVLTFIPNLYTERIKNLYQIWVFFTIMAKGLRSEPEPEQEPHHVGEVQAWKK